MSGAIEGPLVLVVMDGVGDLDREVGNAVKAAHTPTLDYLRCEHRFTRLRAHGRAVGLSSDKDMGNSEVGHNALGSGQVYDQGAKLVQDAITSGQIYQGEVWQGAIERVAGGRGTLHFMGLLSDGNVHSHIDHLLAMLERAAEADVRRARVHVLLDGRDVDSTSAHLYIEQLEKTLAQISQSNQRDYRIASGGGRMHITMDRYNADWEMVKRGWQHHVHGVGRRFKDAQTALATLREEQPDVIDQDVPGFVIADENGPVGAMNDGDSVIFFNFRGDRAIEISRSFDEDDAFTEFDRGRKPDLYYAGMMQYDGDTNCPDRYLVGPPKIRHTMTDYLIKAGLRQYAISETQKYGHVTYFWNGNRSGRQDPATETFVEIPSDATELFAQRPWMKAAEITDALVAAIRSGDHDFLRTNYANGDMVGHTGNYDAAVTAMSCVDLQLRRLMKAVRSTGGVMLVTADHGNCDEMYELDKQGQPKRGDSGEIRSKTSHTLAPVPFLLYDPASRVPGQLRKDDEIGIANVAATVFQILGLDIPTMWERSLLV